MLAAAR